MHLFDSNNTTVVFDYTKRCVEFYFPSKSIFINCKKRNPNFILSEENDNGYRLVYSFQQVRTPEYLLRVQREGEQS